MLTEQVKIKNFAPIQTTFTDDFIPVLRWGVQFKWDTQGVFLFEDTEYAFGGISSGVLVSILSKIDGKRSIAVISEESGVAMADIVSLLRKMSEFHLILDGAVSDSKTISPEHFSETCRQLFPTWKARLFSHPLWCNLTQGEASFSQFSGWILENYHFIEGVNDRLGLAIAACPDIAARRILAKHYSEEYNHSAFFMQSLNALGIPDDAVYRSRPLPGTLAVLNHMRKCARQDTLYYAVCSGFLESTGDDRGKARTFFDLLTQYYCKDLPGVIPPLVAHVNLDEAYNHNGLLETVCSFLGDISVERASKALDAGYALMEILELWSTDIQLTYGAPDASVPRSYFPVYRPAGKCGNSI